MIRANHWRIGIQSKTTTMPSYLSITPVKGFPDNVYFEIMDPQMPLVEATHTGDTITDIKTDIKLEELIRILRREGMRFQRK
jgi:hypothetical protein